MFTMLIWARTSEARLATWGEFEGLDTTDLIWRVPAHRMKMQREHIVPLTLAVVALLAELRKLRASGYVFAGDKPGHANSQNTMIYGCYRMGYRGRQTVHGFRGIASTWANEAECYGLTGSRWHSPTPSVMRFAVPIIARSTLRRVAECLKRVPHTSVECWRGTACPLLPTMTGSQKPSGRYRNNFRRKRPTCIPD